MNEAATVVRNQVARSYMTTFCGYIIPCANATAYIGETLNLMLKDGQGLAMVYYDTEEKLRYFIASDSDDIDCSEIAAEYDGHGSKTFGEFTVAVNRPPL